MDFRTMFICLGSAFGAIGVFLFLSARSKYKWPKEKGRKREWMTNYQYLAQRFKAWKAKKKKDG